jgi:protein TonB
VKVEGPSAPTLVHRVEPVYPKEASATRVQGTVVVEATVDERGQVQDVRILRSIAMLDAAAIAAVKQWRYEPLQVDGQPASFVITVNVSFHLR